MSRTPLDSVRGIYAVGAQSFRKLRAPYMRCDFGAPVFGNGQDGHDGQDREEMKSGFFIVVVAAICALGCAAPQRHGVTRLDFHDHDDAASGANESSGRTKDATISKVQTLVAPTEQDKDAVIVQAFFHWSRPYWQVERHVFIVEKKLLELPEFARLRHETSRILTREEIGSVKPSQAANYFSVAGVKFLEGNAIVSIAISRALEAAGYEVILARNSKGEWEVQEMTLTLIT